ncbi:uncharacterized protein PADG_03277 [Paracoccidioides brasiliensis Pb18]|uniref:Uncharacterized protein n=1 Tax=Paracoccidioides brasiliensis (strain Pb18) TaxID=502780 RepID=C1G7X2_PARBD|nr:uncharacterized protein PADG_03277 [Paracoccidioides brasiliensis Pb18]EEH47179.2 hypothetical protein PADG_03277 [Paracoccidioides brasiliensis Pb18]
MKYATFALFSLSLLSSSLCLARGHEDPGPSPPESIGCTPHGDHWHCDSPRTTSKHSTRTSRTPAPSPTESVGCTLHVDHWHCSGPATTHHHSTKNTTTTMHHHNGHKTSSHKDPGPSPPGSVGCTPHGDHWHCSGPAMSKTTMGATAMGGPAMGAPATSVPATSVTAMDLPATMTSNPTGAFTGGAALINNARLDQFAAVMGGVAAIMMW